MTAKGDYDNALRAYLTTELGDSRLTTLGLRSNNHTRIYVGLLPDVEDVKAMALLFDHGSSSVETFTRPNNIWRPGVTIEIIGGHDEYNQLRDTIFEIHEILSNISNQELAAPEGNTWRYLRIAPTTAPAITRRYANRRIVFSIRYITMIEGPV